ncbi:hypothetical protein B0H14DRAFT_2613672 [Mycena olivaceomarginata]|nr:hypothetical protein B0H14DRAFT_2613672 [Mycena olivaceomarginata]
MYYSSPSQNLSQIGMSLIPREVFPDDFEYYFQLLTKGLQKKKPSILNIFCVWDRKFCPNCEDGLADGVEPDDEGVEGKLVTLEEMNAEEPEDGSSSEDDG